MPNCVRGAVVTNGKGFLPSNYLRARGERHEAGAELSLDSYLIENDVMIDIPGLTIGLACA